MGEMFGWLTLSDHNADCQVIALGHSILERILDAFRVGDLVLRQLLLPLLLPLRLSFAVILWIDDASGLILEVRDNVAPSLVIVNAESHDEAPPRVGHEAKGAGGPAPTHLQYIVPVDLVPGSTVGVFPNCVVDYTEKLAGLSLVDKYFDTITHF